jgi:DNA modification methylase
VVDPYVNDVDFTLYMGDVREVLAGMPDESVHCCVTSPPYWGLRNYDVEGQIGLEATPEEYVARIVEVFREVRRVLRSDGTCFLNLGDSFAGHNLPGWRPGNENKNQGSSNKNGVGFVPGLKPKDLVGIPWRVAFALQADGWWLRSDIIWAKPNQMPESVTDRPTKSHEYLFLLTKSARYFYDADAIREPAEWAMWGAQTVPKYNGTKSQTGWMEPKTLAEREAMRSNGRNARSVWEIATQPYSEAHFATFPQELPRRCIAAGTSEHGCCPECGAPWERKIERGELVGKDRGGNYRGREDELAGTMTNRNHGTPGLAYENKTVGWKPTCEHGRIGNETNYQPAPCTVLDIFMGSGTTALVARRLGRKSIGVELNPQYAEMCARRLGQQSLLAEDVA